MGVVYKENRSQYHDGDEGSQDFPDTDRRTHLGSAEDLDLTDSFQTVDITVPTDKDGLIEVGTGQSAEFPWSEVTSTQSISVPLTFDNETTLIAIRRTTDNKLRIASREDHDSVNISVFQVDLAEQYGGPEPVALGVPILVETQDQTFGDADERKHLGQVSLLANADAGHRIEITSNVDGTARLHKPLGEIKRRVKLNRIGDGVSMTLKIVDNSASDVRLHGYRIAPVSFTGRR